MSTAQLLPAHDLRPRQPVELFAGPASVWWSDTPLHGRARVSFDWFAGARVEIQGDAADPRMIGRWYDTPDHCLLEGIGDVPVGICDTKDFRFPSGSWRLGWTLQEAVLGDPDAALDHIDFQLCNLPAFSRLPDHLPEPDRHYRITLKGGGWQVLLDQHPEANERFRDLRIHRTADTMHAGRLTRTDSSSFRWDEAESVLFALTALLSFTAGNRVPVVLPVGHDPAGSIVVRQWGDPKREAYGGRLGWWSVQRPSAIAKLWPQFIDRWQNSAELQRVLQLAIELHMEGHIGNIETRLVKVQTALELMAWHWLTDTEPRYERKLVDDERPAWRFRKMLDRIGVSAQVPTSLPAVRRTWPGADGPKVITDLRNDIVHPKDLSSLLSVAGRAGHEVLRLATWYVELSLLRLLDYTGDHLNQTRALPIAEYETENVPWALST